MSQVVRLAPPEKCALCGHFIRRSWRETWNYFAHESAAFCHRCPVPDGYRERQEFLVREAR